ncbi:MAG: nucleotide sugar dehydrogenase [Gemmatimonadetes bacterium]|nr:nucleotide sugar dehydrogenase [Gemmatimonadota bacterium]MBT5800029.1 nucleotide sugar dehydrogenase [Gemmatimonadota bacterium]MBT6908145.1 nucleotide sugar dehydrogenase [Gemmatimonadota bacterium]MBT7587233.1 nucleotide sugar dehydrogenase [Gemmatimonadota bacterium]
MELYKRLVLEEGYKVGVWGLGYIGLSTAAYLAQRGVRCVGCDVNAERVGSVQRGEHFMPGMDYWLGFDLKPLVEDGHIEATTNWRDLIHPKVLVHFIGVPTERDNEPYYEYLEDVITKIAHLGVLDAEHPPLIIVESTLTPNTTDKVIIPLLEKAGLTVGEDVLLGVAPRRDWFLDSDKNLTYLDRIYGGYDQETADYMQEVLGIVCQKLHRAQDHRHAEIVKSVENAYRHMEITLANQLALAYPSLDMIEILRLVGTKWNVGTFRPGIGTGGYCIPLSSKYVLQGAEAPDALTLLQETIRTDDQMPTHIGDIFAQWGCRNVGVLGISYKGDIKVPRVSRSAQVAQGLAARGISVALHDPYFTAAEVEEGWGLEHFEFPGDIERFDGLLVAADHREYTKAMWDELSGKLANCRLIIDNCGIWKDVDFKRHGIRYMEPGTKNWLAVEPVHAMADILKQS